MSVSFSERLKDLILFEGITEYGLAQATKIPLKSIHNWTRGVYYPAPKALLTLADFFKVTTDYLLGLSDDYKQKTTGCGLSLEYTQKALVEKLNAYVQQKNIKKHRLAELLGVGQCTLSRWFTGSMPETAILIRTARLLDVSLEELLGRE